MGAASLTLLFSIVAFLLGLLSGSYLSFVPLTVVFILVLLAGALTWCERKALLSRRSGLILYAGLVLGLGYWFLGDWNTDAAELTSYVGSGEVTLSGTVVTPVVHGRDRRTMVVAVQWVRKADTRQVVQGRLRLTWREPDADVFRGDTMTVRTRLRRPFGTRNPGGFDYGAYLRARGIHVVATVKGPNRVRVHPPEAFDVGPWVWHRIDQWRNQVRQAVTATLQQPARGLFLGTIVGEQRNVPADVRDDFVTTGTVHIISISGSHLGLLAFLSFFVVKGMIRLLPAFWLEKVSCILLPRQLAVLVTIPLVIFYTLLSGSHDATVRSLIMILFYCWAAWIGHARHLVIPLALAALFATLADPMAIYDLSCQFSYMAVLAIALVLQWNERDARDDHVSHAVLAKLKNRGKPYVLITLAVTVATLPLVAYYFNQVAWFGVFANAVVVPFVGFLVVPLGLGASVLVLLGGLDHLPFAYVHQAIITGLTDVVGTMAAIPGVRLHAASPSPVAIAGFYCCLLIVLLSRNLVSRWKSLSVLTVLTLCFVWWVWVPRHVGEDKVRVTFLDVGQGDATVIELPDQTVLVDGGVAYDRWDVGRMVVAPYLWDQGIRRIDHVIATHPQLDHVGGLPWIIKRFEVGRYWSNGVPRRKKSFYKRLTDAVEEKGLEAQVAWEGTEIISEGPCRLLSLNPSSTEMTSINQARDSRRGGTKLNNLSVVLNLTCGTHSILLPADAEIQTLNRLLDHPGVQSATVVKIPHHGGKSSLNRRWIQQLRAKTAVVSAGRGNRYGHPAQAVLRAYRHMDVYRTDSDGAIVLSMDLNDGGQTIQRTKDRSPVLLHPGNYSLGREWNNVLRLWQNWATNG